MQFTKGMEFAIQAAMRICGVDRETVLKAFGAIEAFQNIAKDTAARLERMEANQRLILAHLGERVDNGEKRSIANGHGE